MNNNKWTKRETEQGNEVTMEKNESGLIYILKDSSLVEKQWLINTLT